MSARLATLLVALSLSTTAFAETQEIDKKVVCDLSSEMLPWFKSEHGEEAFWVGNINTKPGADPAYVAIVTNPETKSWSVVMYNKEIACLLESGDGFRLVAPKSAKKTPK